MSSIGASWVPCDSRIDLEGRLATLRDVTILPLVETRDANTWGFVRLSGEKSAVVPVGYSDAGLVPETTVVGGVLLLGISEIVAGIDLSTGTLEFQYRMPTIFHQFVRVDNSGVLLQDEIGFVLLSPRGEEQWRFCKDLIEAYKLSGDDLLVTTFEGEHFQVKVGSSSLETG